MLFINNISTVCPSLLLIPKVMVLVKLLITSATLKLVEVSLNVYEHEVDTVSIPHQYYRLSYGLFMDIRLQRWYIC